MKNKMKILVMSLVVAFLLVGCGEVLDDGYYEYVVPEENRQSAVVTPEFRIAGLDELPEELILERMSLSISEIRLEPLRGVRTGFAYSTTSPFQVIFDLSQDENSVRLGEVEFPETGRFLVSIRLEPNSWDEPDLAVDASASSLDLEGKVRNVYLEADDDDDDDEKGDGNPLPLPFERPHSELDEETWTSFRLSSQRSVFYTFSDVRLVEGEQVLTFEFDMGDWALSAARPIVDAVEMAESSPEGIEEGFIDLSRDLDTLNVGPETLMDSGSVTTVISD